jgi:hypothetical protein
MGTLRSYGCLGVGGLLLYFAAFLYRGQLDKMNNRLEDLWLAVAVTGD